MLQKRTIVKALCALVAVVLIVGGGMLYFRVGLANVPTVAVGDAVQVYYTGTFTNGTVFDSNVGKQTLNFTVGANQVISGFDQGVIGMSLNQNKTITIPPNEAYGQANPALIIQVPLSQFGNQTVDTGTGVLETFPSNGLQERGIVTAINGSTVTVDFNPAMAGKTLVFNVKVVGISKK
jgi:FKBP-type peptidyl-prolyl cis-trans isomerase 2